ncbi:MAG: hypothetical protein AAFY41_16790 [Bacteroidota bacterium]
MKKLSCLLAFFPFILLAQAKNAEELRNQGLKKYNIESAEIQYDISGDADGEEMMIFEAFGWKSLKTQAMTFELYGITSTQSLIEITDGDFIYRINEADSTYTIRKDSKWSQQATYKIPEQVSEAILFTLGGQHSRDSTLLNKQCQIWTFQGKALQELWIWNGLALKRKLRLGDRLVISTATSVQLDVKPLKGLFQIPDFYQEKK